MCSLTSLPYTHYLYVFIINIINGLGYAAFLRLHIICHWIVELLIQRGLVHFELNERKVHRAWSRFNFLKNLKFCLLLLNKINININNGLCRSDVLSITYSLLYDMQIRQIWLLRQDMVSYYVIICYIK